MRSELPELAWIVFAVASVALMFSLQEWQTVPFHFIWVSLTILYGFRRWSLKRTALVLALVSVATGAALAEAAVGRGHPLDELTEVPLMGAVFLAMVWHARRRQAAVDALGRAASRERDFGRDASHELRTPITIARGHLELARIAVAGEVAEHDVVVALDELDRLASISARLLALAAATQGDALTLRTIDADDLLTRTVARWGPVAPRAWACDPAAVDAIVADAGRLETALDALVENAVAATAAGDAIALSCRAVGDTVEIEVRDSGCGIEAADLERVFERFARCGWSPRRVAVSDRLAAREATLRSAGIASLTVLALAQLAQLPAAATLGRPHLLPTTVVIAGAAGLALALQRATASGGRALWPGVAGLAGVVLVGWLATRAVAVPGFETARGRWSAPPAAVSAAAAAGALLAAAGARRGRDLLVAVTSAVAVLAAMAPGAIALLVAVGPGAHHDGAGGPVAFRPGFGGHAGRYIYANATLPQLPPWAFAVAVSVATASAYAAAGSLRGRVCAPVAGARGRPGRGARRPDGADARRGRRAAPLQRLGTRIVHAGQGARRAP